MTFALGKMLLLFLNILISYVAFSSCCPSVCRCDEKRKVVYCNERKLTQIPYGIPLDTRFLLLQGNLLTNSPTMESMLSRLTQLEKLDLHDNRLTSFPDNLPSSLNYLSLRLNWLKFIGKNVMNGLTNLRELYLDSNNLTNAGLASSAFSSAAALKDLILSNNQLTALPENLPKSLENIRVGGNLISVISPASLQDLDNLLILDLSHNKLESSSINFDQLKELKTLELDNNFLQNVPAYLPANLSELRLASNKIQYIFFESGDGHGSFNNLKRLKKLDLSSNHLISIEKRSFDSLPSFVSMELQNNPWKCDCNLAYLKEWLSTTTSILVSSKSGIRCNTPVRFQGVTLEAIDMEALQCSNTKFVINVTVVDSLSVIVEYDVGNTWGPPYLRYSVMYGVMLCEDCILQGGTSSSSHLSAHLWMEDYTITPMRAPGVPNEIKNLKPNTRYVICIFSSNQHPDQIGISQCRDFRTLLPVSSAPPLDLKVVSLPEWVFIVIAVAGCLIVVCAVAGILYCKKKRRRGQHQLPPGQGSIRPGRPLVDASPEFDVTLIRSEDLKRQRESYYSDSRDESVTTTHTGTTTSQNSGREPKFAEENIYETPFLSAATSDNYDRLRLNNQSGLYV